jgi:hypothetical protein
VITCKDEVLSDPAPDPLAGRIALLRASLGPAFEVRAIACDTVEVRTDEHRVCTITFEAWPPVAM